MRFLSSHHSLKALVCLLLMSVAACADRIVYVNSMPGENNWSNYEILTMNVDGSNVRRLTHTETGDLEPSLSPDGKKIAFVTAPSGGIGQISVMNADGTGRVQLTPSEFFNNAKPSWSPDGSRIAWMGSSPNDGTYGGNNIFTMNADGSDIVRVPDSRNAIKPRWSPDGSRFSYSNSFGDDAGLYTINADGTGKTRLTTIPAFDSDWSPDGSQIVFGAADTSFSAQRYEIWKINVDGSNLTQLTNNNLYDASPTWSLDGSRIAYASIRPYGDEIRMMNADGSGDSALSFPARGVMPDWGAGVSLPSPTPPPNEIPKTQRPPRIILSQPSANSIVSRFPAFVGTVSDPEGPRDLARVNVTLCRVEDGRYWTGRNWSRASVALPTGLSFSLSHFNWRLATELPVGLNARDGIYRVVAIAIDHSGLSASTQSTFTLDRTPPQAQLIAPIAHSPLLRLNRITVRASDGKAGSGVRSVQFVLRRHSDHSFWTGTAWQSVPTLLSAILSEGIWNRSAALPQGEDLEPGIYTLIINVTDQAGNIARQSVRLSVAT